MAIFRKYKINSTKNSILPNRHYVVLYFSELPNDTILYALGTSMEALFPNGDLDFSKAILDSKIGSTVKINLYKITMEELTDGIYNYVICENSLSSQSIKEIYAASIMERSDEINKRKATFSMMSFNQTIIGVKNDVRGEITDPGIVFNLRAFLNYEPTSKCEKELRASFGYQNPDIKIIKKAVIEYKKKTASKYKGIILHLFD